MLRIEQTIDAVDPDKSKIEPSAKYDYLKITRHLGLDHRVIGGLDLFRITDMTLGGCLFASERFRDFALKHGARLAFVPEAEAAEAYGDRNPLSS